MARPLRPEFPGALYHLTSRGNNKQEIFLDDVDRETFLFLLDREIDQQRWRCYAFCLMSNHYHLLIETPEPTLARGMGPLNSGYSRRFNRRHSRVGHLFQRRYHSILVEKQSYLLELSRYIVLNPVRAGMVDEPENWLWSSYNATLGAFPAYRFLQVDWLLSQFGQERNRAVAAYRRFVREGVDASPWSELRDGVVLGSREFHESVEKQLEEQNSGGDLIVKETDARPAASKIVQDVLGTYDLAERELWSRSNQEAYQVAVYLLRRAANLSLAEVRRFSGASPSRICNIQRRFEGPEVPVRAARLLQRYQPSPALEAHPGERS